MGRIFFLTPNILTLLHGHPLTFWGFCFVFFLCFMQRLAWVWVPGAKEACPIWILRKMKKKKKKNRGGGPTVFFPLRRGVLTPVPEGPDCRQLFLGGFVGVGRGRAPVSSQAGKLQVLSLACSSMASLVKPWATTVPNHSLDLATVILQSALT